MIRYIVRRLLILPIIMFLVTLILFFLIMQLPIEQRVQVYLPPTRPTLFLQPEEMARLIEHTRQPHPSVRGVGASSSGTCCPMHTKVCSCLSPPTSVGWL